MSDASECYVCEEKDWNNNVKMEIVEYMYGQLPVRLKDEFARIATMHTQITVRDPTPGSSATLTHCPNCAYELVETSYQTVLMVLNSTLESVYVYDALFDR